MVKYENKKHSSKISSSAAVKILSKVEDDFQYSLKYVHESKPCSII